MSFKKMLGYSIAATGDYAAYGFIFSFLSFFLTTIAGVKPSVSGIIISIAVIWDAITDPMCGIFMDAYYSKDGKRRAIIKASVIPLGAAIVLLFLNVNFSQSIKNVYYCLVVLLFWTFYTLWNIPYYSLGSVITTDEKERTKISGIRQVTGFIGTFCASSLPTFLVGKMVMNGIANDKAWLYVSIVIALIVILTISIMLKSTRGMEPLNEKQNIEKKSFKESLKQIPHIIKLKYYQLVILAALFTNIYMSLFNASVIYFATFNLGIKEIDASLLFTIQTIVSIALVPLLTRWALSIDKKNVYVICMSFSGIVMILAKFIGINTFTKAMIYMGLLSVGPAAYWMFIFNFLYDVIDTDEGESNERKDGIIMSFYSFLLKLGGALASLALGIMLEKSGFSAEAVTQSAGALSTIESIYTILPGLFMLGAGLVMILSPLTKKKMEEVHNKN